MTRLCRPDGGMSGWGCLTLAFGAGGADRTAFCGADGPVLTSPPSRFHPDSSRVLGPQTLLLLLVSTSGREYGGGELHAHLPLVSRFGKEGGEINISFLKNILVDFRVDGGERNIGDERVVDGRPPARPPGMERSLPSALERVWAAASANAGFRARPGRLFQSAGPGGGLWEGGESPPGGDPDDPDLAVNTFSAGVRGGAWGSGGRRGLAMRGPGAPSRSPGCDGAGPSWRRGLEDGKETARRDAVHKEKRRKEPWPVLRSG